MQLGQRQIEIDVPQARLAENDRNRERLEGLQRFVLVDRVPVLFCISSRYLFDARGVGVDDYYASPRVQLEQQLLNHKWLIEHAVDDRVIDTSAITVAPDLSTLRGGYFDVDSRWFNDGSASAVPILRRPEDVDALEVPHVGSGLYGRKVRWYHEMTELASEYEVALNGEPLHIRVTIGSGGGPVPDAYALAGQRLFLWMGLCPDRVHRLMDLLSTAFINFQRHVRDLAGRAHKDLGLGCDAGEMLSDSMFREFVVPYYRRCYDAFPGERGLHMCGKINHLIPTIRDALGITHLNGFGFPTSPELLAEWMGGQVVMSGGLNPITLFSGPKEAIQQESLRYLQAFSSCGGYLLQDGNNVAPGTPLGNLAAVVEAATAFGK